MSAQPREALIAGFDAGQTHTTCRLARLAAAGNLEVVAEGRGPGVCHLAAPGGEERFAAALRQSLANANTNAANTNTNAASPNLAAAGVGASGIERRSPVQEQARRLTASVLGLPTSRVLVSGDERTALRGAFPKGEGILVISGTGCIAVGRNSQGAEHRCGGWGWLLDGSGSAMDIGHEGLMLSVRMADGRDVDTALRSELWRELNVTTAQQLKALVVGADFGPAEFAALAPCVHRLAEAGDPGAQQIVQRSAESLAELVLGVARQLGLTQVDVAAVGGAVRHLHRLRQGLASTLNDRMPGARLVAPAHDACHGALLMALDRLGEPLFRPH